MKMKLLKFPIIVILCMMFMNLSSQAQTSFSGTHRRVIGSLDVIRFLYSKFRMSPNLYGDDQECRYLDFSKHIILGTLLPQEKVRLVEKPEPSFVEWYLGCVESFATRKLKWDWGANNDLASYEIEYNSKKEMLGTDLWTFLFQQNSSASMSFSDRLTFLFQQNSSAGVSFSDRLTFLFQQNSSAGVSFSENKINFDAAVRVHWSLVSDTVKKSLVTNLLDYLVGPEFILEELQYIGANSSLVGKPQSIQELVDILLSQKVTFTNIEGEPTVRDATIFYSTLILSVGTILIY